MKKRGYFKRYAREEEKRRIRKEFKQNHPIKHLLLTIARILCILILIATFIVTAIIAAAYILTNGDLSFLPDNPILNLLFKR
jgi:hypothetical protein